MSGRLGKLKPPYPFEACANKACGVELADLGAFLFRDLDTDKLVIVCEDCAMDFELNRAHRFMLVPL